MHWAVRNKKEPMLEASKPEDPITSQAESFHCEQQETGKPSCESTTYSGNWNVFRFFKARCCWRAIHNNTQNTSKEVVSAIGSLFLKVRREKSLIDTSRRNLVYFRSNFTTERQWIFRAAAQELLCSYIKLMEYKSRSSLVLILKRSCTPTQCFVRFCILHFKATTLKHWFHFILVIISASAIIHNLAVRPC